MDFIERIFHIAPDYGSGTLEAAIVLATLAIPFALAMLRASRTQRPLAGRFRG